MACCLPCGDSFTFDIHTRRVIAPTQSLSNQLLDSDITRFATFSTILASTSTSPDSLSSQHATSSLEAEFTTHGYCHSATLEKLEKLNMHMNTNMTAGVILPDMSSVFPTAPQLDFDKFLSMQDKRVVVTIIYSGEAGLKPYFLTVAKKLKANFPDVIIERRILPTVEEQGEATFEVLVDGNVVVGKGRSRKQKISPVDMAHSRSVFVSMQAVEIAISRARKRRRPSTTYGEDDTQVSRLEMLRENTGTNGDSKNGDSKNGDSKNGDSKNDYWEGGWEGGL
jgi:hypothetical protein